MLRPDQIPLYEQLRAEREARGSNVRRSAAADLRQAITSNRAAKHKSKGPAQQ